MPVILRPTTEEGKYSLISAAYIDGVMYGEALGATPTQIILLC